MLNPNDRKLYLEALKPPAGYTLDRGIATTFSLDLLTLLIVPLSFVLFDYDGEEDLKDQTKVLEALQRTSERLTIYCQRGRISVPKVNLLYSYLENTVVEVNTDGTFHPKTWLLRFTADDQPAHYRFTCLSRNLTFDKSWDTLLVLDGELKDTDQDENKPLVDYIRSLLQMEEGSALETDSIINELSRVKFEAPPGFNKDLKFWPLGIEGYRSNPLLKKADQILIVSPFVSDNLLKQVAYKTGASCILLSRIDSLDALSEETLALLEKIYVLDEPAPDEEVEEEGPGESQGNRSDLHAKLYIIEQGNKTRVLTGSANATNSGFNLNTEFLVEMRANKKDISIDSLLFSEQNPLGTVVREYRHKASEVPAVEEKRLEDLIDEVRRMLTVCSFNLQAVPAEQKGTYDLNMWLNGEPVELMDNVQVLCWPITQQDNRAISINETAEGITFKNLSAASISSFMAFEVTAYGNNDKRTTRFVLNLPLNGIPEDRNEKILISIISDRNRFLRYLIFLLTEGQVNNAGLQGLIETLDENERILTGRKGDESIPLMEEMVRALSRKPEKIDRIDRLVRELKKSEEGREILPDDFNLIWDPIWEARQRMVSKR